MNVEITAEDIAASKPRSATDNLVAISLKRALHLNVSIRDGFACVEFRTGVTRQLRLPPEILVLLLQHREGKPVHPCTFEFPTSSPYTSDAVRHACFHRPRRKAAAAAG